MSALLFYIMGVTNGMIVAFIVIKLFLPISVPCSKWFTGRPPESLHLFPLLAIVRSTLDGRLPLCAVLVCWDDADEMWLHSWNHSPLPSHMVVVKWAIVNVK